jgi:hypothetical protein
LTETQVYALLPYMTLSDSVSVLFYFIFFKKEEGVNKDRISKIKMKMCCLCIERLDYSAICDGLIQRRIPSTRIW